MINLRIVFLVLVAVAIFSEGFSQSRVRVNPSVKRYLGEVSELDRSRYFNMHATSTESGITDDEYNYYVNELRGGFGRGFWSPFSAAKQKYGEVGTYPSATEAQQWGQSSINYSKNTSTWWRRSTRNVVTDHPQNVIRWSIDVNAAAEWAANYFKYYFTDDSRPEFYEVMNEPFVHAGDDVFKTEQPDQDKMRRRMAEWYAAIGKKFDETPELANVKVVGYSSAWPSMELWDFGHWESRQKMFMDVAGDWMDAFAIHLYDGINVTGADSRRSGSNSEAILDLVETYSNIKWHKTKPFAITEFGGIESKDFGSDYSDIRSVQSVKSMNHLMFNLLERENNMLIAIPFIGSKATWHITAANNYQPYGSVLWRPKELGVPVSASTEWVFTPRVHFFELWRNVQGSRVYIESENPDIQLQAFLDGNKLYIILDNLDEQNQTVNLDVAAVPQQIIGVVKKSLKIWTDKDPQYTEEELASLPQSLTLIPSEAVVLECTYDAPVQFQKYIRSRKYYSDKYLQPIGPWTIAYAFNNVETTGEGLAYLRMAIGRKHDKSKKPQLKVNGTTVEVPDNWAGGPQASRDDFFGVIQIPVPISLIKTNNVVEVTFPDYEGRIASMILQVESMGLGTSAQQIDNSSMKFGVFPNPVKTELRFDGLRQEAVYEVYSLQGQIMQQGMVYPGRSVHVESLPDGMYFIRLKGVGVAQFVKQ